MNTSNSSIERAHGAGEKSNDKERLIVVQSSFYKDRISILRNCKKLKGTKISISKNFSIETIQIRKDKWKEVLAKRKQDEILYLQYRSVICKEGRTTV